MSHRLSTLLVSTALATGLFAALCPALAADAAHPTSVAKPVEKVDGQSAESVLSPELSQVAVAKGAMTLDGATLVLHSYVMPATAHSCRKPVTSRPRPMMSRP